MESLYAYFGLLELHDIDSPGHSLYQLGLLDSISEAYCEKQFEFYSYYPKEVIKNSKRSDFPQNDLGDIFKKYKQKLISNNSDIIFDYVLNKIKEKKYQKLYLKARFRNISTLSKKWKDAKEFESFIDAAITTGYSKSEIIILDTDLSLSNEFISKYSNNITILIPSIDFPGISSSFLLDCVSSNLLNYSNKQKSIVYYGNIDTSSYKSGNSKAAILSDILTFLDSKQRNRSLSLSIISKTKDFTNFSNQVKCIKRNDRLSIWQNLQESLVMLNITKEKYNLNKFIPARVYEAMIFGMIPVSYKFNFLNSAFSFETIEDLEEILIYLAECDLEDLKKAYLMFISDYQKYVNSL